MWAKEMTGTRGFTANGMFQTPCHNPASHPRKLPEPLPAASVHAAQHQKMRYNFTAKHLVQHRAGEAQASMLFPMRKGGPLLCGELR